MNPLLLELDYRFGFNVVLGRHLKDIFALEFIGEDFGRLRLCWHLTQNQQGLNRRPLTETIVVLEKQS